MFALERPSAHAQTHERAQLRSRAREAEGLVLAGRAPALRPERRSRSAGFNANAIQNAVYVLPLKLNES